MNVNERKKDEVRGPHPVILKEGRKDDPILSPEDLIVLEQVKVELPAIHLRYSSINKARRRYIYGDDEALDET